MGSSSGLAKRPSFNKTDSLFIEGSPPSNLESSQSTHSPASNNTRNSHSPYNIYIDDSRFSNRSISVNDLNSIIDSLSEDTDTDSSLSSDDHSKLLKTAKNDNFINSHSSRTSIIRHSSPPVMEKMFSAEPFAPNLRGKSSIGTISTSMLLNTNESDPISGGSKNLSTSSPLPCEENASTDKKEIHEPDSADLPIPASQSSSFQQYDDTIEPAIEEAVKLLKREASQKRKNVNYITPKTTNTHSSSTSTSTTASFIPQNYKIPQKALHSSSHQSSKRPPSSSLLSNRIVPSPKADKRHSNVPLSHVHIIDNSSPSTIQTTSTVVNPEGRVSSNSLPNPIIPNDTNNTNKTPAKKISSAQLELAIETINQYRAGKGIDLEKQQNGAYYRDEDMPQSPIQHIDTESIHSFDSQNGGFWSIFSLTRIISIVIICLLIPPFFFMIALGEKGGVSNYRIMRMIMNTEHRLGLYKGFIWDVDVNWFRMLCLLVGTVEILCIFAGIAVGFGVGLTRE